MTAALEELAKHLQTAARRFADSRVFAFHDDRVRDLPGELNVADDRWRIVFAPSELAIRAAMIESDDDSRLAIVTPLETRDLGRDVRARIANHQLLSFDRWQSLLPLFEATGADSRLRKNDALGRALLGCAGAAKFPPARTGVLGEDEAWGAYFTCVLSMTEEPAETDAWVRWFINSPAKAAELLDDAALRDHVLDRARSRCGETVKLVFRAASRAIAEGADIGVRLHALAHAARATVGAERAGETVASVQFQTRLEDYFEKSTLKTEWLGEFAAEVLRTTAPSEAIAKALDAILEQERATGLALYSDISNIGYEARTRGLGDACVDHLRGSRPLTELLASHELVRRHRRFQKENGAFRNRVDALVRLTAKLAKTGATQHPDDPGSLARDYVETGSHIDALRESLAQGDLGTNLAEAASHVLDLALEHSTERNLHFGAAVVHALQKTGHVSGAFFVHEMMPNVLAPLSKERDVLVVVIDGLSWFVARQITEDRGFEEWLAYVPAKEGKLRPMLAAVPSITTFSRTSLLTGVLQKGGQSVEKKGFESQPHLQNAIGNKRKSVLFHKKELDAPGPGKVGAAVAEAIADAKYRVVGVVLNAVDDQLGGSDQLAFEWDIDAVPPLKSLLQLASAHGRDVLVVADHGYIWDGGTNIEGAGKSARHRELPPAASDGEFEVQGDMINRSGEGKKLVVACSERIRYTGNKRGYHGGVSLQELVAPCILLTTRPPDSERWTSLSMDKPAWWHFRDEEARVAATAHDPTPASDDPQMSFFVPQKSGELAPWIAKLLASKTFDERRRGLKGSFDDDQLATLFATLDANQNRAYVATLAEAIEMPLVRMRRRIPTLQKLLNVEGFRALDFDRSEDVVRLDRDTLKHQFHL